MPNGNFALGNTYETVSRPVAFGVAKEVLSRMGFPDSAYMDFTGTTETSLNEGSTMTPMDNKNFFGTNTEARLKIREEPITDRLYEMSLLRLDQNPIFRDPTCHSYVRPAYQPTKMELTFNVRFKDEVEAQAFRDDTFARSTLMRHEGLHRITYSWPIPKVYLVILHEIYKLKEKVDQVGDSFNKWLRDNFDPRVTTVTNRAGNGSVLVVAEDQVRVQGYFDFSGVVAEPTYNKELTIWECEFVYQLVYDKPVEATLSYPLVVRQQMLEPAFRPTEGMYKLDQQAINPSNLQRTLFSWFHNNQQTAPKGILDARYPDFDDWYPVNGTRGCVQLWIGLTTISLANKRDILSIDTLGHHKLSDAARTFILSDRKYVVDPNRSLFDISVYSNDDRALPGQVILDEHGMIQAKQDISMQPIYHVVISFRRDLTTLSRADQERMLGNACAIYAVLKDMYPAAVAAGFIPPPSKRCTWTWDQWNQIVDILSPTRPGLTPYPGYDPNNPNHVTKRRRIMQTVGSYHIITRRN